MKVMLVIHSLACGGAERVTMLLANHWARLGWRVTVVTLADAADDHYRLDAAVQRLSLGLADRSETIGQAVAGNFRRLRALRRALRVERPDVVVAMMVTSNVLVALARLGLDSVTAVGSERSDPEAFRLSAPWPWLRAVTYRWLDAMVALTDESREWLERRTSARRVVTIPNPLALPLPMEEPVRSPGLAAARTPRRLLAVGRLGPEKGYDQLLACFGRLAATHQDWELVIVGEGPERPRLERLVQTLGLGDRVFLPGRVGNPGDWYASADLFVLSSRYEGFPNALAEAMGHGLPVVSVDCTTGPRELIRDGVDGVLVPLGNDTALDHALDDLMRDEGRRKQLGLRALEIRERLSIERVHEQWVSLFATAAR